MGRYFSDVVEQAIEDLYYCYDRGRAQEAANALAGAATDTEDEDGDACYILCRCFAGESLGWKYHPFTKNEAAVYAMLRKGIFLGSALAVVGAVHMGLLTEELREVMPFPSLKEAWEAVLEKARDGCVFCQYLAGSVCSRPEILEMEGRQAEDFENQDALDEWRARWLKEGLLWCEKAFEGGMGLAGRELYSCCEDETGKLHGPDREKAMEVMQKGAELGYPDWMFEFGEKLYMEYDQKEEGLFWVLGAAERGHLAGWRLAGDAYQNGDFVKQDLPYALECYEKAAAYGDDPYACSRAGEMYFLGLGAPKDYAKAVLYLEQGYAFEKGEHKHMDLLGLCFLLGYGCEQDVRRGRLLLEGSRDSKYKSFGLGVMYGEGLGIKQDIERGVAFLQAAGDYPPAREALKRYKKDFLGRWKKKQ